MTTKPVVRLADADESDSLIALRQRWTEERRGVGPDQLLVRQRAGTETHPTGVQPA